MSSPSKPPRSKFVRCCSCRDRIPRENAIEDDGGFLHCSECAPDADDSDLDDEIEFIADHLHDGEDA